MCLSRSRLTLLPAFFQGRDFLFQPVIKVDHLLQAFASGLIRARNKGPASFKKSAKGGDKGKLPLHYEVKGPGLHAEVILAIARTRNPLDQP